MKYEVEKHNNIIGDIDILDQLQEVGNPITLESREQVIDALSINKDSLIRAIKTERILRENPQFCPEQFNIDLTSLQSLQMIEQAGEYGQLLNEALDIAMNVQKEMNQIVKRR